MAMNDDEARVLDQWSHRLAQALQILDLNMDQEMLLDLARKSSENVIHAAAPVTTFLVGYAAALEAGTGSAGNREAAAAAIEKAAKVAFQLIDDGAHGGPAGSGWADTGQ
ncbi:DUF6457 domain-containing protein [Arthrobacter sp. FX8]|uniref:DUF6457 domain-containing protein n=1 Tax=Arthrobacter sp. FX8 TaxID=2997335 RepID=UPI00227C4A85|nr:DUF6457 domain-containing protein [Arthrobacter sp. FX8]WAJ33688.1 DUF6457 domain-containing protein [Arthrobacter sp. FX8]